MPHDFGRGAFCEGATLNDDAIIQSSVRLQAVRMVSRAGLVAVKSIEKTQVIAFAFAQIASNV